MDKWGALLALLLLAGGCTSAEKPGTKQASCSPAVRSDGAKPMLFEFDLGRHRAIRLNGASHPVMSLEVDSYSLRFRDKAGNQVTIGRYDGAMTLEHAPRRGSARVVENWTCNVQKMGQLF
jgi:hypothetical protein